MPWELLHREQGFTGCDVVAFHLVARQDEQKNGSKLVVINCHKSLLGRPGKSMSNVQPCPTASLAVTVHRPWRMERCDKQSRYGLCLQTFVRPGGGGSSSIGRREEMRRKIRNKK